MRNPFLAGLRMAATVLGAWVFASAPANAQLTDKPVRVVVPYAAGGPLDAAARILAERLQPILGRSVVVENKPGAGGNIGVAQVARAPADGHMLVIGAVATHAINPWLYQNMPYDPIKDFTPISLIARVPNVLVMPVETAHRLGIQDTRGLIAYAKKHPGKLSYASGGNGSAGHLAGELFKSLAGISMVHIPYAGAAPAQLGMLGGQTELMFDNLASAAPKIKAGQLLPLGVTTLSTSSLLAEVPAINETLPGFHLATWFGVFGPARLPPATLAQLNTAFQTALRAPETAAAFRAMSTVPSPSSPSEFGTFVEREHAQYGRLIRSARIKLDE
jgi:tripartite-type tricarboxylate transporter receptor subunit TctC